MGESEKDMQHGDFTALASHYARHRAGYSEGVLKIILNLPDKKIEDLQVVDIGAGTGIWTRMVARCKCKVLAIEPNDEMRQLGIEGNREFDIEWKKGTAERTGLPDNYCDLVTMASSFHWTDFDRAVREFNRIFRPKGWLAVLWNSRLIEINPLLVEIENKLCEIVPDMKRVSSGRSEFCNGLTDRLYNCGYFREVFYVEGRHVERMTPERYMGIWRSVNDVQVQAGKDRFEKFMGYIQKRLQNVEYINAMYLTRAWVARKR